MLSGDADMIKPHSVAKVIICHFHLLVTIHLSSFFTGHHTTQYYGLMLFIIKVTAANKVIQSDVCHKMYSLAAKCLVHL
jgi:hypothetical protein